MHPVEHLLYFSGKHTSNPPLLVILRPFGGLLLVTVVVPHMFVFGHPLHLMFNAQHTGLTPAGGHHGFDGCDGPGVAKYSGSYFHYLHHRYFECNYGEATIPLDKWFGSFRDGQSAQDDKISSTPGGSKEATWITVSTCIVGTAIGLVPLVPLLKTALA